MDKPALFLTNDDGVEADGLQVLIKELHTQGYPIVVLAPASEQSCSGMRLTLDNKSVSYTHLTLPTILLV